MELEEDPHFRSDIGASGVCLERNRKFDMLSPPQTPNQTKPLLTVISKALQRGGFFLSPPPPRVSYFSKGHQCLLASR